MPRIIPDDIKALLTDRDWLTEQHVNQLMSISELAKQLHVTENVIRKALRSFSIVSPSQQALREASNMRKYGVKNTGMLAENREKATKTMNERFNGHNWRRGSSSRTKALTTKAELYGDECVSKNDSIRAKISSTKLGDAHQLLTDDRWLREQVIDKNISITQLSTDLGVSYATLIAYVKKAGIDVKRSILHTETLNDLNDVDWLIAHHVHQRKTCVEIADELGISVGTVSNYMRRNNVDVVSHSRLDDYAYNQLSNRNWLYDEYVSKRRTYAEIGRSINVTGDTVKSYAALHDIPNMQYTHKLTGDVFLRLSDKNWLIDQHHGQQKSMVRIARELGLPDMTTVMLHMRRHGIDVKYFQHSAGEKEVADFIKSLGISNVIENDRSVIAPKELDIYLPDHKLAIEYCGLYWHSDSKKHYAYHQKKHEQCEQFGIRLLTIYENEWNKQQNLVKNKIQNILGMSATGTVFARKCVVESISKATKQTFFNTNHIQGDGPSSINYALKHGDQIVAVIGFIAKSDKTFVLNRYATSCNVPGGFSKLLKHFQRNNDWKVIETFADLRWSNGKLYYDSGFEMVKKLPADYAYIINGVPCHKFAFRRKYLQTFLENFNPSLSEWENMNNHGYERVWDCGKLKFVLTRHDTKTHSTIIC